METINYGINRNYLSHWGLKEAYREIVQNFMDYGDYTIARLDDIVTISNDFKPENLEFLSIGHSLKKEGSRGKYGEGLKMALLIMCREEIEVSIKTQNRLITPVFVDSPIGQVLAINLFSKNEQELFSVSFKVVDDQWDEFHSGLVLKEDVIFDDKYYGRIVNKTVGNIYCGGLLVKNIKNISRAYDINPSQLSLDRDRKTPPSFDVSWATSKINQAYGKIQVADLSSSDTAYVDEIPLDVKEKITPRLVGNSIEATYKLKGKDVVIKNERVRDIVLKDNFFKRTIMRLRNYLINKLGVYQMLVDFRSKHIHSPDAIEEFNLILERLK